MHLIAASLAALLCTAVGFMKAKSAEDGKTFVRSFLSDVRALSAQMEFTSEPLCTCIGRINKNPDTAEFWEIFRDGLQSGKTCGDAWNTAYESASSAFSVFDADELFEISAFFPSLGKRDKQGEKQKSQLLCAMLEKAQSRTEESAKKTARLWKSLGALAGIGIAILII